MGKTTGFLEFPRELPQRRPIPERVNDWFEIYQDFPAPKIVQQGARCMDCGVPFCHTGCPVNNIIPDWNDLIYRGRWRDAIRRLHATNNFPEFTGRICPAPCEAACVLGINQPAVTIKNIEKTIVDRAFEEGWIVPEPPQFESGKKVQSSDPARRDWPPPNSCVALDTASPFSRRLIVWADCSGTAFRTSNLRSKLWIDGWRNSPQRACSSSPAHMSA